MHCWDLVAVQRGKLLAPATDEPIVCGWLNQACVWLQRLENFLFFHVGFVPICVVVPPLHLHVDASIELPVSTVLSIRSAYNLWWITILSRHACAGSMAPDAHSRGARREEWAVLYWLWTWSHLFCVIEVSEGGLPSLHLLLVRVAALEL